MNKLITALFTAGLIDRDPFNSWIQFACPFARWTHAEGADEHPSFSYNVERDWGMCFACKEAGRLWDILIFCGTLGRNKAYLQAADMLLDQNPSALDNAFAQAATRMKIKTPPDLSELERWYRALPIVGIEPYLYARKYTSAAVEYLAMRYGLRWDAEHLRVVIPIYVQGRFLGAQGRDVTNQSLIKTKHYTGTHKAGSLVGPTNMTAIRRLCVVEGPFDMFRLEWFRIQRRIDELGIACVFGSALSETQQDLLAAYYLPVVILFDNDGPGQVGAMKAERRLMCLVPQVRRVQLPEGVKDPDELNDAQLEQLIKEILK